MAQKRDVEEQIADPHKASKSGSEVRGVWKVTGIALLVGAVFLMAREGRDLLPEALTAIREFGPWAAVAFIALYATATVAWVPGSALTLAAGAIFGLVRGTLFTLVGANLGASLAFLISRYLARGALERRLHADSPLAAMDEAIGKEGGRMVFLLRLSPAFPFNVLNYALGLTQVRFRDYFIASAVGMVPGTFLYVYAGFTAGQVVMSVGAGSPPRGLGYYTLLVVGLLATVAVTVLVTRAARRALRSSTAPKAGTA
jgi:uncharacterized membrane protein YdjX (TVP38/TMEM64 family)